MSERDDLTDPTFRHNRRVAHLFLQEHAVMTREINGHHINSFNREHLEVLADSRSNGGASHVYSLTLKTDRTGKIRIFSGDMAVAGDGTIKEEVCVIKFQMGSVQTHDVGFNGITDEALLAIVLDRLQGFQQGPVSCRENAIVITKLEECLMWLRKRAEDRERRGVEGTSQK